MENNFQPGNYFLTLGLHHNTNGATIDYLETIIGFKILNFSDSDANNDYLQNWLHGYLRPNSKWTITAK